MFRQLLGVNPEGRKIKGVIHWVSAPYGLPAEIRLYNRLFIHPTPDAAKDGKNYKEYINPDSLHTLTQCIVEPNLAEARPGENFQFEREGYFCLDPKLSKESFLVFNRSVTLRDSWSRLEGQ
jgi:glutaminyl-tRNA synthetase